MPDTNDLATAASQESAFLDGMRHQAGRWITRGAIVTIVAALVLIERWFGEAG